jgi:hypothetical protein
VEEQGKKGRREGGKDRKIKEIKGGKEESREKSQNEKKQKKKTLRKGTQMKQRSDHCGGNNNPLSLTSLVV